MVAKPNLPVANLPAQSAGGTAQIEDLRRPSLEYVARMAGANVEDDREVLEACRDAALEWYKNAGVPADTQGSLYPFWVANLAAWFYDNRGNAEGEAAIPFYIISSVHQLRYTDGDGE